MGYGSGIAVRSGTGHRCRSDPVLLWLWHRLAAVAPIQPLASEPPYAADVALKRQKQTNKQKIHERQPFEDLSSNIPPLMSAKLCFLWTNSKH